ncbi:leucine-rich repeat domain-containing protein [Polaribacter litorisediminis]|uniref:leucine-rich repeat domain-containing protein n=1 Tax=Polaribacter litorisediminis TaxID=1908341 RepID=UPI001CBCD7FE|nr:leucine-rich repeat domain-containing protein [Polaribacter litorisediminis]UAM99617.1 leucine-rich repeat domain-containing protein [Polaribacter litorisediminis]
MKTKLILFFTFLSLAINAQVSQAERQALIDFYNATNGDNWTNNTNWNTDPNSTSDVSTWFGVTTYNVDGQKHVARLFLNSNNLVGGLPDFKNLTKLLRLEIANNSISGEIDVNKLPSTLQVLQLSTNDISGNIPDLTSFSDLLHIQLTRNKFVGNVSESLFPLSTQTISIGYNNISGTLDFSSFPDMRTIITSESNISFLKLPSNGIISSVMNSNTSFGVKDMPNLAFIEVPNVSSFTNLRSSSFDLGLKIVAYDQADKTATPNTKEREALKKLYENKSYTYASTIKSGVNDTEWLEVEVINGETRITEIHTTSLAINGPMPTEIGVFTELTHLHIPNSGINTIATELKNATKLEELYLNNNSITAIPNDFYDLVKLKILNINNNQIPSIAAGLGNFLDLEQLYFSNTQVDLIPTTIGNLKKLQTLEFASTRISLLPPQIGGLVELTRLVAAPNNIASIPSEFGQLTKLQFLDFANCELSNTPAAFANLTNLETLFLNDNELQVVAGLGGFTKLKFLRLHNNRLGEDNPNFNTDLPEDMSDLVDLEELTLYNNQLKKLPTNIGNLNKLTSLQLNNNRLTSIPLTINGLTNLLELRLQGNNLTSLPTTIGGLSSLQKLYLSQSNSNNKITGLPDEIGDLGALKELYLENMRSYENSQYVYHLTSLPTTMNKLLNLEVMEASNSGIGGLVDLTNLTKLKRLQLNNNKIADLKIDAPVANFNARSSVTYHFNISSNPFISCVEVPTAQVSNWDTRYAQRPQIADNGIAFSDSCAGFRVPQTEREALIAFYIATNGGDKIDAATGVTWVGTNWSTDAAELTNVGSWQGVTTEIINGQKHVTKIELTYYINVSGNIPKEIAALTELTRLDLSNGSIETIATEIGNLGKLQYLNLSNNNIEILPTGIGNFASLIELNLSYQYKDRLGNFNYVRPLTSLPDEIGNIATLEKLDLSYNGLTSLPSGIGNFANLKELRITYQETRPGNVHILTLTNLPDEIGNIASLEKLYLNYNALTEIPSTINGLTSLIELRLEANNLTELPTTIGGLTSLEKLYLSQSSSNNKITSLPDEIGNLSNLKELYIENMQIRDATTGGVLTYTLRSLPTTMNKLLNLEVLEASYSGIEGLVDLTNLTKLTRLQLNNNKITDLRIDAPVSNFSTSSPSYHFNISSNPFISCVEVPIAEVSNWDTRYAQRPQIADNGIAFSDSCAGFRVPQTEREALIAFYIATNGGDKIDAATGVTWVGTNWSTDAAELTNVGSWQGVTTEIINGQKHVTKIELTYYINVSGNIPKEIAALTELTRLDLSNGSIETIATEIGNLGKLQYLNLSNNNIEILPTGIGNFASLIELNLSYQYKDRLGNFNYVRPLTSLPDEIGNIATLEKLDLSYNGLTSLPSGIGNFANLKELRITYQETRPGNVHILTLTNLPDEIGNIASLEKLYLNYNALTEIPSTINGLTSLIELRLEANNLTELPTTIGGLTSLEKLYLSQSSSNNKITSLPDEIGNLSNLKELYIENMQIRDATTGGVLTYTLRSLPTTMNKLLNLEVLEASYSGIEGLVDLTNLTKLTRLQLNNNKITDLRIDAPVSNFSTSSPSYHFNISSNPFISCVEVPIAEVSNWDTRYAQRPQTADNGIAFSDSCTGFRVPQTEREALIAFYIATNGGDKIDAATGVTWVGTNWSTDAAELTNVGSWQGVTTEIINGQKHVTKIELTYYINVSGNIPKEIAALTELTRLDLLNGSIETIATEIGNLSKLQYLNLSNNRLKSLPAGIGNFTSLVELNLSSQLEIINSVQYTATLTSLPNEIGNIATLEKLNLSYNGLESLPSGIGNFANLKELNVSYQRTRPVGSQLTYTLTSLPDEIGNITSLEKLQLQYNNLRSLPLTITNLENLENLNIEFNEISNSLDLSNSEVLRDFRARYNNISELKIAVSPTIFGTNVNPTANRLRLNRNALGCIEVPTDELVAWQLSNYQEEGGVIDNGVVYSDNCSAVTNNSIPDAEREALIALYNSTKGANWSNDLSSGYTGVTWVADATQKRNVGAWFGVTTGIINGQKHVTKVELNSNQLDGTIPSVIKNLTQLKGISVRNNNLISIDISKNTNLEILQISNNGLTVLDVSNNTKLQDLDCRNNNLTCIRVFDIDFATTNFQKDASASFNLVCGVNTAIVSGMWSDPANWSGGIVPTSTDNVFIPSGTTLQIGADISEINSLENEGTIIINSTFSLKSKTNMVNNGTIIMNSDNEDSSVLFVVGTATGDVKYSRGGLKANLWSLVTPPVSGQNIKEFALNTDNDIRVNAAVSPGRYAIGYYDDSQEAGQKWNYYTEDLDAGLTFTSGESYALSRSTDGSVSFTGTLTTTNNVKTLKPGEWNAIGNPFTTYYPANKNGASSFINDNYDILEDEFKGLYIWNSTQNKYVVVSELDIQNRSFTPGQGFFIKVKADQNSIEFKEAKRSLKPTTGDNTFSKEVHQYIKLSANNGAHTVTTDIKFFSHATKGFDIGLDLGNFSTSSFDFYSHLVDESNTNKYAIQSINLEDKEEVIIPITVLSNKAEVQLSSLHENLPENIVLLLEDRENDVFTDITNTTSTYKISFDDAINTQKTLYLHIGYSKALSTDDSIVDKIQMYAANNTLYVQGLNDKAAAIELYNVLGQGVFKLASTKDQKIDLPASLKAGIYTVKLISENKTISKKIVIK